MSGVTKTSLFNYEKGDRSPDAVYLAALAAIGLDVSYVVTGVRTPQASDALSREEARVVSYFRRMPETDKESVLRLTFAMAESAGAYHVAPSGE